MSKTTTLIVLGVILFCTAAVVVISTLVIAFATL
jgi:hypothetical protein